MMISLKCSSCGAILTEKRCSHCGFIDSNYSYIESNINDNDIEKYYYNNILKKIVNGHKLLDTEEKIFFLLLRRKAIDKNFIPFNNIIKCFLDENKVVSYDMFEYI